MRFIRQAKNERHQVVTLAALALLGGLLFAEPANAGLFNRRARAYEASGCYGYSVGGYSVGCYGAQFQSSGGCYGGSMTYEARRPFQPIRNLLRVAAPRAVYVSAPSNAATYYYPAPAPASGYMGGYAGSTLLYGYGDSGYVNNGSPGVYPPSWQARCPGGVCPSPQTPSKQAPPPAPLPPPAPPPKHDQHAGGGGNNCPCGDVNCTHGVGVCPCRNARCICEHAGGRRGFPR